MLKIPKFYEEIEQRTHPNSFYKASITLVTNLAKMLKAKYIPISLIRINEKSLILSN